MTLAEKEGAAGPLVVAAPVDPWGLWAPPEPALPQGGAESSVSFAVPGAEAGEDSPAAVWSLPLRRGPGGALLGVDLLERRTAEVQTIEAGLEQSESALEAYLSARQRRKEAGEMSFSTGFDAISFAPGEEPPPEFNLELALAEYEPVSDVVSFAPGFAGVDWDLLRGEFDQMVRSVDRQLLHFAWVDTTLDGTIAVRTKIRWGGEAQTYLLPRLSDDLTGLHYRSLGQALASSTANLNTVLTVTRMAAKIALAPTNPISMVNALALGWQFAGQVIVPLLKKIR